MTQLLARQVFSRWLAAIGIGVGQGLCSRKPMRMHATAVLLGLCVSWGNSQPLMADQAGSEMLPLPALERLALLQLFEKAHGEKWVNRDGWAGPAGTECEWYGVICNYTATGQPTVEGLFLGSNGLSGTLPEGLSALTNLRELLLDGNRLTGSVPSHLLRRFDQGQLRFLGYAGQFSPIVEIRLDVRPTATICGDYKIRLTVGGSDTLDRKVCESSNGDNRATFWERSSGRVGAYAGDIDRLARLIETVQFSALAPAYSRVLTHGTFETVTVVYRDGARKSVEDYAESAPAPLWLIKRAIAGAAFNTEWEIVDPSRSGTANGVASAKVNNGRL